MTASRTMPTTKQEPPRDSRGQGAEILKDDRLAATASAYLDGRLSGEELSEFEKLLENNKALAREVQEIRNIELQLMKMGSDILSEPVPDALLDAFSRLNSR
jgi:anti-sigma factor RsiW